MNTFCGTKDMAENLLKDNLEKPERACLKKIFISFDTPFLETEVHVCLLKAYV